jgi:hypothetical protein
MHNLKGKYQLPPFIRIVTARVKFNWLRGYMQQRKKMLGGVLILVAVLSGALRASESSAVPSLDVLTLKNGDRISGVITSRTAELIQLRTMSLGVVTVRAADVANLQLPNQEHKAAGPVLPAPSPNAVPSTFIQISLNAPETVIVGTQNQNTFGGNLRFLSDLPNLCSASSWYTALLLSANHDRKWKVKSAPNVTDTFDGTLSLNNKAFGKTDWYVVADLFGNSSIGVGLQQGYGGGLSRVLYSNGCNHTEANYSIALTGDLGVRYVWQRLYAPGVKSDFVGIRPNLSLSYSKLAGSTKKEQFSTLLSLWAMPMVNDSQATQAGGAFQFSVPLNKSLSIAFVQEDDFVNNAPKLRRKNYLKSGATVTYTFPPSPSK